MAAINYPYLNLRPGVSLKVSLCNVIAPFLPQHKAKAKQMEEELMFGSKPITPAKRRMGTTPGKTPNSKLRKVSLYVDWVLYLVGRVEAHWLLWEAECWPDILQLVITF